MKSVPLLRKYVILTSGNDIIVQKDARSDEVVNLKAGRYQLDVKGFNSLYVSDDTEVQQSDFNVEYLSALDGQPLTNSELRASPLDVKNSSPEWYRFNKNLIPTGLQNYNATDMGLALGEQIEVIYSSIRTTGAVASTLKMTILDSFSFEFQLKTTAGIAYMWHPIPIVSKIITNTSHAVLSFQCNELNSDFWVIYRKVK